MFKKVAVPALLLLSTQCLADLRVTDPVEACAVLAASGLPGIRWRDQEDGTYGCGSDYKEIGSGYPLANNLAYYVEGDAGKAVEAYLVLNVYQRKDKARAIKALADASGKLAQKVLGGALTPKLVKAVESGTATSGSVGSGTVEILRDDWANGKGYEIHVVMK
jgi:hypothetical protein